MDKKISRRKFLTVGAKTIFATVALTACADLVTLGAATKKNIGEVTVGEDKLIISLADLKENKAINFNYKGKKSILLYNDGEIRAFENICTHKGGPSHLVGDKLICQWHGAIFDPLTGASLRSPAPEGSKLPTIALRTQDGRIYIDS